MPVESFFNFFNPPKPPKNGELDDEEADLDELDERLELDYQIGEDLKDRIIPHAVDFSRARRCSTRTSMSSTTPTLTTRMTRMTRMRTTTTSRDDRRSSVRRPARRWPARKIQECKQQ